MKQKNKTELPRGYLSWSQIDLIERNPQKYIDRYLYGQEEPENKYMKFGTETHENLQEGRKETCIVCKITRNKQTIKLLGYLDDLNGDTQIEYKTATKLWSERKAKDHGQMKLYALIHYKNTGVIPNQELRCHETANIGGMILTGEHRAYPIKYELKDMLEMEARVWKAHDKIIALVEKELNNIF